MSNVECRMPSMIWKHLEPWYSAKFWKNPLQSIRKMMNLTRKRRKFAKIPIQLTVELFDADCAWSCCVPISLSTTGTIRGGLSDVLRCPSFVFCVPVLWFTVPIPEPSSAFSEPSLSSTFGIDGENAAHLPPFATRFILNASRRENFARIFHHDERRTRLDSLFPRRVT